MDVAGRIFISAMIGQKSCIRRELHRKGMKQLARKRLPERYQPFETDYRLCPFGHARQAKRRLVPSRREWCQCRQ